MKKMRKGDEIIVITGKDKGKLGVVSAVHDDRVVIEGINLVKKHVKPNPAKNVVGGIEAKSMSIHVSNVALRDANGKASRVGIKIDKDDKKHRVLKTTGAELAA